MAKNFRLAGQSQLRNAKGDALRNRIGLEVVDGTSRAMADSPVPIHGLSPVETKSRDVARFLACWNEQIERTAIIEANQTRDIVSDPKPKDLIPPSYLPDYMVVACPACNGEGYFLCDLCEGDACVTAHRAQEWRDERIAASAAREGHSQGSSAESPEGSAPDQE